MGAALSISSWMGRRERTSKPLLRQCLKLLLFRTFCMPGREHSYIIYILDKVILRVDLTLATQDHSKDQVPALVLMELEVFEPALFTGCVAGASAAYAEAILARLG